jgi:amidase
MAPLAVGTETDGSIVSPASACGIVGIKPTAGLVSRTGIVPVSPVQDTAGPMAATVADAAALLSVLAAADPLDPAVDPPDDPGPAERFRGATDYSAYLDPGALDGARIGIWRSGSAVASAATRAVLDVIVTKLRKAGATVVDPVELPEVDKIAEPEWTALKHEFKYGINAYLRYLAAYRETGGDDYPGSLEELISFNTRNAHLVLSRFGQEIFEQSQATSGDLTDPDYLSARAAATRLAVFALEAPAREHRLDAIVSLTGTPPWLTDYVLGDHEVFGSARPAAVSGWPSLTVPAGYVSGLPVGATFTGPRWSEPRLIALAYAFEQAGPVRRVPRLAYGEPSWVSAAPPRDPRPALGWCGAPEPCRRRCRRLRPGDRVLRGRPGVRAGRGLARRDHGGRPSQALGGGPPAGRGHRAAARPRRRRRAGRRDREPGRRAGRVLPARR